MAVVLFARYIHADNQSRVLVLFWRDVALSGIILDTSNATIEVVHLVRKRVESRWMNIMKLTGTVIVKDT